MMKKISLFIISFYAIMLLTTNKSNELLIHTGRLRPKHLIIGAILIVVGGIIFVLLLDYILSPKKKKNKKKDKK